VPRSLVPSAHAVPTPRADRWAPWIVAALGVIALSAALIIRFL